MDRQPVSWHSSHILKECCRGSVVSSERYQLIALAFVCITWRQTIMSLATVAGDRNFFSNPRSAIVRTNRITEEKCLIPADDVLNSSWPSVLNFRFNWTGANIISIHIVNFQWHMLLPISCLSRDTNSADQLSSLVHQTASIIHEAYYNSQHKSSLNLKLNNMNINRLIQIKLN